MNLRRFLMVMYGTAGLGTMAHCACIHDVTGIWLGASMVAFGELILIKELFDEIKKR